MIQRIPITGRDQWLSERSKDVTASVVGALMGPHPYATRRSIYEEKTGRVKLDIDDAVLRRGRLLEPVLAQVVGEDRPEWKLEKATEYLRDPSIKLGATPDYFVHGDPRGLGVLQLKTVMPSAFRKAWTDEAAPFWIAAQTISEMMLTEAKWGGIAVLTGVWNLDWQYYEVPRHEGMEKRVRREVIKFWQDIELGLIPDFDLNGDADLIEEIYPRAADNKMLDLTLDNEIHHLLDRHRKLYAMNKSSERDLDKIKAAIKAKLGDAEKATVGTDAYITWKNQTKAKMIPDPTQPRSEFRVLRVTDNRPKDETDAG